jgi:Cys-rich repeat protein
MERLHVAAAGSILFFVCLACRGSSSSESTATSASAAPIASAPATTASAASTASAIATSTATTAASSAPVNAAPSNAADVTRFPDEKKLSEKATLEWSSSKVRKKPQGDQVAALAKGTSVTKIAEHQGFFLITFADPKDATKQLEGWVYKDAFTPEVAMESSPVGGKCPDGMKLTQSAATGKVCSKICTSNAQCSSGFVCYSGTCISAQGE